MPPKGVWLEIPAQGVSVAVYNAQGNVVLCTDCGNCLPVLCVVAIFPVFKFRCGRILSQECEVSLVH